MRRSLVGLLMLALCAFPAAARDEWYDYYGAALEAIDSSEHLAAIPLIEAALKREPRSGYLRTYGNNYIRYVPHFQLGVALHGAGECERAVASFEASRAAAESAELPALGARLEALQDDCVKRLAPLPEPVATPRTLRPLPDRERLESGLRFYLAGDFERSGHLFEALVSESPGSARLRLFQGMALHAAWTTGGEHDEKLFERARFALATAAKLDPRLVPDPAFCPPRVGALFRSLR